MLVMQRAKAESVIIGDYLLATVDQIEEDRVRIAISRRLFGGRLTFMDDIAHQWIARGESTDFERGVRLTVVDIRGDKVRIGIAAPPGMSVHRKEVYDAINRENSGDSNLADRT